MYLPNFDETEADAEKEREREREEERKNTFIFNNLILGKICYISVVATVGPPLVIINMPHSALNDCMAWYLNACIKWWRRWRLY